MYTFFLSYATGAHADNQLVDKFYRDLCADVQLHLGVRDDRKIGFFDRDAMRAGMRWSDELVDAVATCSVFLALCSPAYFASRACGQEWGIFQRRLAMCGDGTGRAAEALIPLAWVVSEMPEVAAQFQHDDPDFGNAYTAHGLRDLARQPELVGGYQRFVEGLARRIVQLTRETPVPRYPIHEEFETIVSAFHPPVGPRPTPATGPTDGSSASPFGLDRRGVDAAPDTSESDAPPVPQARPILKYLFPPDDTEVDTRGRQDGEHNSARHRE